MKIKEMFKADHEKETPPLEYLLERFRNWRKIELAETDWTQLSDAPAEAAAFAIYRQELRDLPNATNFANVDLPVKPA